MARNKEALILLVDVGPTMHKILPEVEKICSLLMEKKLIYHKYDEIGVVLFGTKDTDNDLTKELGGYEHVVVLQRIKVIDEMLIEVVQQLSRGTTAVLDAIVVGMDLLIKKYGETNKGKKRVCLITDLLSPIKEPYEGTKDDQVLAIAEQMDLQGMKLECIVVGGDCHTDVKKRVRNENEQLLCVFNKKCRTKIIYVESPVSMLGAIRTRNIMPVTLFRGDLEMSSQLKIKVWVYKKTCKESFPSLKKYSDKAPPSDKFATHEVKVDYEYKSVIDPERVVPPEQRIKGFRYGPQVVPISSAELEAVKFKPEKGVKLLGFTDASNILRHYYMKDVNIVLAEPGNKNAGVAISALARAMKEMNKVAILRCVFRQGQANVVIAVLTPNVSEKDNIPDSFYFNVLPFAEDLREFQFPSFSNLPSTLQPTDEQQTAADDFVKALDLAPPGKQEVLKPELTPNLILQHFYHFLELKSKHPDAAVPPLDKTLKSITGPDPELVSINKSVIDRFQKYAELKENPKMKKSSKRIREKLSGSDGERDNLDGTSDSKRLVLTAENSSMDKIETIGELTPVQDFEAMLSRRDSPDWVHQALKQMRSKILDLIEDSCDNNRKALECLIALRKGCVVEQEPMQFNDFIRYLSKFCKENNLLDFYGLMSKEVKPITKEEAEDSDVAGDEAGTYLLNVSPKVEPKD
ncbi:hypothetical protein V2J09_015240 [Rumex salicifolius]